MWEIPKRISRRKFKTLEAAKEKVLEYYPTAIFIDTGVFIFISVRGRSMGIVKYVR